MFMRRDWDPSIRLRTCATEPTSGIPMHLLPDPACQTGSSTRTWPARFGDSESAMFFLFVPAVEIPKPRPCHGCGFSRFDFVR